MVPIDDQTESTGPEESLLSLSGIFAEAIKHSDLNAMGLLAANYRERNITISDEVGREVMDHFLYEQDEMKARIQGLRDISDSKQLIRELEEIEEWADQIDNGVNFFLHGGTEYFFNRLVKDEGEKEVMTHIGRVLVASLQNNEHAQQAFLDLRPQALNEIADVMTHAPKHRWLLNVGSALLRRTPEVKVSQVVLDNDEIFIDCVKKVAQLNGKTADKAKDLLAFINQQFSCFVSYTAYCN